MSYWRCMHVPRALWFRPPLQYSTLGHGTSPLWERRCARGIGDRASSVSAAVQSRRVLTPVLPSGRRTLSSKDILAGTESPNFIISGRDCRKGAMLISRRGGEERRLWTLSRALRSPPGSRCTSTIFRRRTLRSPSRCVGHFFALQFANKTSSQKRLRLANLSLKQFYIPISQCESFKTAVFHSYISACKDMNWCSIGGKKNRQHGFKVSRWQL